MILKIICFTSIFVACKSYKILGLFPHPTKSHVDVFSPILKELARRGHEVVVISHFPSVKLVPNYTDISLRNTAPILEGSYDLKLRRFSRISKYNEPLSIAEMGDISCNGVLNSEQLHGFIKFNKTFDVILYECFNSDCILAVLSKIKGPLIGVSSSGLLPWHSERLGEIDNPSYIPNIFMDYSFKLTFFERLENAIINVYHRVIFKYIIVPNDYRIVRKYFDTGVPDSIREVQNTSLFFSNTHFSLNFPRPHIPGFIEIGGVHIKNTKKLNTKLEKWVNESTEGVVYFSLGSVIKGHTFPEDKKQAFLRAFGRIPQRVLWKWENDTMPGKPDNVMIQKWMPQLDILCHPNVKAFISHGGLLGTTEAVHCGVPVIVMPQFGDQFTNAKALEANGGGVILHLYEATEEKVYNALKTVLHPDFRKKAKELSERFRDRPLPPLETAIYWVEYVARHKGARHMRTAAVDMPFYQYLLLDVIAFLAAVILLVLFTFYYTIKTILRCIFARNKNKIKTN